MLFVSLGGTSALFRHGCGYLDLDVAACTTLLPDYVKSPFSIESGLLGLNLEASKCCEKKQPARPRDPRVYRGDVQDQRFGAVSQVLRMNSCPQIQCGVPPQELWCIQLNIGRLCQEQWHILANYGSTEAALIQPSPGLGGGHQGPNRLQNSC